jgi:signal recognition particle subunit SRP54
MFDSLSDKLQEVFKRLRGETKLTEENMAEALREVRRALLEADVSLAVVKDFILKTKEAAVGQEVLKNLNPSQQLIKVVHDQLVDLLGGEHVPIQRNNNGPTVILMAGLQGSGKTTSAGKLGLTLRKQGMKPLLVACDIYRPAAIQQLQVLGKQIDVPVFTMDPSTPPVEIARQGLAHARQHGHNYVIVDTAGRLHIDEALMAELKGIQEAVQPQETLLVVDSMIGQDAVKMAEAFHAQVTLTGVVLTKLDGDTRGGAALSVKAVTGCPIKYMASGEKIEPLVAFHPERIATRILGMGDVLTLIEKAQENIDEEEAKRMEQKLRKAEFTLEDFMSQMKMMKKIGSFEQILSMIPGVNQMFKSDDMKSKLAESEQHLKVIESMINSMTVKERRNPDILNASRKVRVARGSGTSVQEIYRLLRDFQQMKKMVKMLSSSGMLPGGPGSGKKGKFKMPKGFPNFPGMPPM